MVHICSVTEPCQIPVMLFEKLSNYLLARYCSIIANSFNYAYLCQFQQHMLCVMLSRFVFILMLLLVLISNQLTIVRFNLSKI